MLIESALKAFAVNSLKGDSKRERVRVVQEILATLVPEIPSRSTGWNLKARAITSNESFWRSESPASRFHSKKRLAFYPSISPSWAGGRVSSEEASAQETVDFRIRQRNSFGFSSVVSLANLPQRSPSSPFRGPPLREKTRVLAILFTRVFVSHGRESPIDRWMVVSGGGERVKGEYEWPHSLFLPLFLSLSFEGKAREIFRWANIKGNWLCSRSGKGWYVFEVDQWDDWKRRYSRY